MNNNGVNSHRICVYIETEVQFQSIEPVLERLLTDKKTTLYIFVPVSEQENQEIFDETAKVIQSHGYKVNRSMSDKIKKTKYQVLLSPYIYHWQYYEINAKYYLQYSYGSYYFNKPNWNISRLLSEEYLADAILSHAVGTQEAVNVVSKTYITPELRLANFKPKPLKKGEKRTIAFVPTYNDLKFAIRFIESIDDMRKQYRVILRGHHRSIHVEKDKVMYTNFSNKFDAVYDSSDITIKQVLEESDLVISDNSSAFLEAMNVRVPVALFSKNPNEFRYRDINSTQYDLVEKGEVLWTNQPQELMNIIERTLRRDMIERQRKASDRMFPVVSRKDPVDQYMDIINIYMEDQLPSNYYYMKRYWIEKIENLIHENDVKELEIKRLKVEHESDLKLRDEHLNDILSSTSWRLTEPVRAIGSIFRRR